MAKELNKNEIIDVRNKLWHGFSSFFQIDDEHLDAYQHQLINKVAAGNINSKEKFLFEMINAAKTVRPLIQQLDAEIKVAAKKAGEAA